MPQRNLWFGVAWPLGQLNTVRLMVDKEGLVASKGEIDYVNVRKFNALNEYRLNLD